MHSVVFQASRFRGTMIGKVQAPQGHISMSLVWKPFQQLQEQWLKSAQGYPIGTESLFGSCCKVPSTQLKCLECLRSWFKVTPEHKQIAHCIIITRLSYLLGQSISYGHGRGTLIAKVLESKGEMQVKMLRTAFLLLERGKWIFSKIVRRLQQQQERDWGGGGGRNLVA